MESQDHGDAYNEDFLLYVLTEQNYELAEKVKRLEAVSKDAVTGVDQVLKAINHVKLEGELGTAQELEGEAIPRMGRHCDSAGRLGAQTDVSLGLARGLEGDQVPARRMEAGGALLLDPCRPTHDTTGDVLRFTAEMKKQSERLAVMEMRNRNMEEMITSLTDSVRQVAAQLEVRTAAAQSTTANPRGAVTVQEEQVEAVPPPSRQTTGGARARALPTAPQGPLSPQSGQSNQGLYSRHPQPGPMPLTAETV